MSCKDIGHLSSSGGNGMLPDNPLICFKLKEPILGSCLSRTWPYPGRSIERDADLREEGLEHWELVLSVTSFLNMF
jgi:hypothetical protein